MSYKKYHNYSDEDKKAIIEKLYLVDKMSFADISQLLATYSNKIRRDAIRYKIPIRDKSEAQSNALQTGKHKHPTKGQLRSDVIKQKIGQSVMESWDSLDDKELLRRKKSSKKIWEQLSDDEKEHRLNLANQAVRVSSKQGSKLEKFLLEKLVGDGYKVDFHKEQLLSNTRLQIDLFLPTINIAIEVDGPSHFLPVWGEATLTKNQKYDQKKTGLIIGKGLKLIRIKQTHDFSKARAHKVYLSLVEAIKKLNDSNNNNKTIEIED